MEEFPFRPPADLGRTFPTREEGLSATVARQVCKALDPEEVARAEHAVRQAHFELTGRKGFSAEALSRAGFPVRVRAVSCRVSEPKDFFERFEDTPLYREWGRATESDLGWAQSEYRALAFHWVGWKVCVLHNVGRLRPKTGRFTIPDPLDPEGEDFYVDVVTGWAAELGWHP